jgi:TrmH family RNA methyltransferase
MEPALLTSPSNPAVREFREAAAGKSPELILLEGRHLLEEALSVRWPLRSVLIERGLWGEWSGPLDALGPGCRVYLASRELIRKAGTAAGPEGVLALGLRRDWNWPEPGAGDVFLFLDEVQDPSNVGILVRSARAFGLSGVFRGEGTADPYKPTALSRSAGAALHLPVIPCPARRFVGWARDNGVSLVGADASGEPGATFPEASGPVALLLGNEGRGLSGDLLAACDRLVSIPMAGGWDSLNVAVAGSLLMRELSTLRGPCT